MSTNTATTTTALPPWKATLITTALSAQILTFGTYTLKSGRSSPYFINCGLFSKASLLRAISSAYASTLHTYALANPGFGVDVLFGPAYKGIALAATAAEKLGALDEGRYGEVGFAYNRKEAKGHGEGGVLVGESLRGKRVVVVDDVITAGTAIREAVGMIREAGGVLVGIVVAVDRQERMPGEGETGSAIGEVRREMGVPVLAVLTLDDIVVGMKGLGREDEVRRMEEYRKQYGATD